MQCKLLLRETAKKFVDVQRASDIVLNIFSFCQLRQKYYSKMQNYVTTNKTIVYTGDYTFKELPFQRKRNLYCRHDTETEAP